jgi:hypothetical protein
MRGDRVIVRAFNRQPLVRRIWNWDDRAVFVCTDENFEVLRQGREGLWPVGIPSIGGHNCSRGGQFRD